MKRVFSLLFALLLCALPLAACQEEEEPDLHYQITLDEPAVASISYFGEPYGYAPITNPAVMHELAEAVRGAVLLPITGVDARTLDDDHIYEILLTNETGSVYRLDIDPNNLVQDNSGVLSEITSGTLSYEWVAEVYREFLKT